MTITFGSSINRFLCKIHSEEKTILSTYRHLEKRSCNSKYVSKAHKHFVDMTLSIFCVALLHRQEDRRLVGHFYDMKNRFWAVGCGLGWAVE